MKTHYRVSLSLSLLALLAGCGDAAVTGDGGRVPSDAPMVIATDSGGASAIVITPRSATLPVRGMRAFGCEVTGVADTRCSFRVEEPGGGAISDAGIYTAP